MITTDHTGQHWKSASEAEKQEYIQRKHNGITQKSMKPFDSEVMTKAIDEFFNFTGNTHKSVSIAFGVIYSAISEGIDYKLVIQPT